MLVQLLCITLAILLGWLYLRWSKVRSFWAQKKVPHLPPHPIWGSLTFLQQINVGIWMKEMYSRFSSPYVGIWLFWRPALIVNDPEIGKRILIKDSDVFRDRFLGSGKNDPIGGLNLFTVNDPLWTSVRRRLTPVFTSSKLRSLHGLMLGKSKQLAERIQRDTKAGTTINLRMMFTDYTTDVIGIASFGVDSDATATGDSHMRTVTKEFMQYSFLRGCAWSSIFFYPALVEVFGFHMFPKKATDYFRKVFSAITKQRRLAGSEHKDLVDALLKIQQEAEKTQEKITDDVLVAQAAVFLQGGFDTSGTVLTLATYEIAYHPKVQEKLYNEILDLKQRLGGKEFHTDDLADLTYMNAVVQEILRKYPPMGFLDRIAARDYEIDDKLTIPAGTPIYVNAIGMQWDPNHFPEPEKFDPDRFLPENEGNIKPNTFMPFGEGLRICIGQRFAYQNIRYALACIFLNFEVRPLPGAKKPDEIEVEKYGIFLMPSEDMSVEFVPRNKELVF